MVGKNIIIIVGLMDMIVSEFATNNFIAKYVPWFKTLNLKIYKPITTGIMFLVVLTQKEYTSYSRKNNNLKDSYCIQDKFSFKAKV